MLSAQLKRNQLFLSPREGTYFTLRCPDGQEHRSRGTATPLRRGPQVPHILPQCHFRKIRNLSHLVHGEPDSSAPCASAPIVHSVGYTQSPEPIAPCLEPHTCPCPASCLDLPHRALHGPTPCLCPVPCLQPCNVPIAGHRAQVPHRALIPL